MRKYRTEVTCENGMVTIEGYIENPPKEDLHVQTYSVDTMDPSVRLGLIEMGWTPPAQGIVGNKRFVRTIEEDNAKESEEKKTEGDAGEALQSEAH